jgi:Tfp pilus assembly protein PilF
MRPSLSLSPKSCAAMRGSLLEIGAGALYQKGVTYLAAGNMERACATLEKVVKDSPQFLGAHVSLAQVTIA